MRHNASFKFQTLKPNLSDRLTKVRYQAQSAAFTAGEYLKYKYINTYFK